jgi:hypothetical protein
MLLKLETHDCSGRYIDLYLSMTWPMNNNRHGICGHIFEIIDYYLFLKSDMNVKILIGEPIEDKIYKAAIKNKYNISASDLDKIINDTIFVDKPKYIIGDSILFVDGLLKTHFQKYGVILKFKNIFTFRCCKFCNHENIIYDNVKVLQDNRIYDDDIDKSIDYVKKLYFEKYKTINDSPENTALIYATKNCRYLSVNELQKITDMYTYDKYLIVSDSDYVEIPEKCEVLRPPVEDLFNKFTDYIYTPIEKKFDCSPRMIAECKHYNKEVIYHEIDDVYLKHDTGLKTRIEDINKSIDLVTLKNGDDILQILNENR